MFHPKIWYPFTQATTSLQPLKIKSAKGIWLELEDGRKIIDCISSWWVNLHGHSHPKIAEAIYQQAQKLEHVIFAGCTHETAENLAEKLVDKLPGNLNRVFFSDDGSTAVEVALKMAYQYWVNEGKTRSTFIAFEGAYHGDTFGAMAVGERSLFTQVFTDLLFAVEFIPFPETYLGDDTIEAKETKILAQLTQLLEQYPDRYAGIIVEPLVQGAGGMRMCRVEFIQKLVAVCHQFGTLVIFDEVMTGFGRTGDWFACLKASVKPDIICLAKGLTGGFLPLAVTVCTEQIYQAFFNDNPLKTLYHGHSYTANPLGCAAALASWELMQESAPIFAGLEQIHLQFFENLKSKSYLEKLRITGTIAAMDIVTNKPGYLNQISLKIRQRALEKELFLRPLGQVLYILPPYCISDRELALIYHNIEEIVEASLKDEG